MSHKEYIDKLCLDELDFVVEYAQERIRSLRDRVKTAYWQVSDYWMNHGYFEEDNYEGALEFFQKVAKSREDKLEELILKKVKLYPEDVEGLLRGSK